MITKNSLLVYNFYLIYTYTFFIIWVSILISSFVSLLPLNPLYRGHPHGKSCAVNKIPVQYTLNCNVHGKLPEDKGLILIIIWIIRIRQYFHQVFSLLWSLVLPVRANVFRMCLSFLVYELSLILENSHHKRALKLTVITKHHCITKTKDISMVHKVRKRC